MRSLEAVADEGHGEVARAAPREIRWVALGDSFTAGLAAGERTWADLVHARISASRPATLLNLARVGARTAELERNQLPLLPPAEPTLITLICGGNDVIASVRPALGPLERDLDRICRRLTEELPAARLLTATYPPIASRALRPRTRRRIDEGMTRLNSIIRRLAARHGIVCVELADHPGRADVANYAEDGIHPSPTGHRAAAEVLGNAIEELISANEEEL